MADEMEDEIDVEGFDDKDGSSNLLPKDVVPPVEEYKTEDKVTSQMWHEFGVPVCDWSIDEIDPESRLTIENMLQEEQKYLGRKNGPVSKRSKKKSSPYLRWTPQERLQFEKGFMSYGNRWTQIAKLIPTRSPLQVKNYARYYFPAKEKQMSDMMYGNKNQDLKDEDFIHSHLPDSLNTGSPTVATGLRLQNMHHVSQPSKRRHFQKFGFANLSSSRLLKSRCGKEALSSLKLSKKRTTQKMEKVSPGDGRKAKRQRPTQKVKIKAKDVAVLEHCDDLKLELKDVVGSSTAVSFEQGGGFVRMRPESSEDEDVDVEENEVVEGDKHQESSLMGLAATCDRIYSNLIMPSVDSARSASPSSTTTTPTDMEETLPHDQPESNVRDHKVTQEGLKLPELAWNEDHTYSMSFKALHKLGILRGVEEPTEEASLPELSGNLIDTMDINSSIKMKMIITDEAEHIVVDDSEDKTLTLKLERCNVSRGGPPQEEETLSDSQTKLEERDVPSQVKEEHCDWDCDDNCVLVQPVNEESPSRKQDGVSSQTPIDSNPKSTDTLNQEVKGCVTSEEHKNFTGNFLQLRSAMASLEKQPANPDVTLEMECETVESSYEEERSGVSDEEGQEDSDTMQGETDSTGGEDSEQPTGPTQELILELDKIDEWEKRAIPEFFKGRPTKNPERYLKIRNYIYQQWLQTKPKYLNKATVRPGLKSCGDVNSIGRIHQVLETAGAINYGVENPHKSTIDCRANAIRHRIATKDNMLKASRESMRRSHKKRSLESKPDESQKSVHIQPPRKSVRTGPRKMKTVPYDPFKLIECCRFTDEKQAPFHVRIQSDAMIIMDVHSHMSSTEVIGLLGGRFLKDDSILDVLLAVPCNSISTGMQCEMDPVSQTEAYESILAKEYQVVGWYHSHPAFAANPSVRDIETQSEFQGWFSQGGAPFIGIIVSPCHNYQISQSKVCCLTISKEWSPDLKCRKPYQFDFTVSHSHCNNVHTMNTISSVVTRFAGYQYRSEMLYLWSRHYDISFLEKMLRSIKTYICPNQQEGLLKQIEDFITDEFTDKSIGVIEEDH